MVPPLQALSEKNSPPEAPLASPPFYRLDKDNKESLLAWQEKSWGAWEEEYKTQALTQKYLLFASLLAFCLLLFVVFNKVRKKKKTLQTIETHLHSINPTKRHFQERLQKISQDLFIVSNDLQRPFNERASAFFLLQGIDLFRFSPKRKSEEEWKRFLSHYQEREQGVLDPEKEEGAELPHQ